MEAEIAQDIQQGTSSLVSTKLNDDAMGRQDSQATGRLKHVDPLHMEAGTGHVSSNPSYQAASWDRTMRLAFQSIGVIYGDIGTSPLYVYATTFSDGIQHKEDILGVLALIIYTIILIPMIKYVFIVLWANDNGDGGTFALYSLICRYARVSLIPNNQPEDAQLSNYKLPTPSKHLQRTTKIKDKLETSNTVKIFLLLATILGTSMVIGDGILTPCISVLSAVGGIRRLSEDVVVYISIGILIALFSVQRFGTDKVGYSFAPAICLWFSFIAGIGLYNLFKHDLGVLHAFNPKYIVDYFRRNGKNAWISLGGVVLCITGTEAMFADLGHFNVPAVQISFTGVVLPSLLIAYIGQAAYLSKFPHHVKRTFYDSIPDPLYWPTFIVANAAAIIASQAMISGTFAIISQSLSLGCFPRVKVVHTSSKYEGQVYIPEMNYLLMVACVVVTYAFKKTDNIGNAYGIAVVAVMLITTSMVTLIMLVIWKTKIWWICLFFTIFISVELVYFSSVLYKFTEGGFLPLAFSFVLMIVMGIWHYVHQQRYIYELENKVSNAYVDDLAKNERIGRIPGIGLLYSELVQGIPPIFPHFVSNVPSIHSVVILVSIKSMPISKVALEERFLFRHVEPREYRVFRCVVRYGYKDPIVEPKEFERQLVENLKEFVRYDSFIHEDITYEQTLHESLESPSSSAVPNGGSLEQQMPPISSGKSINSSRGMATGGMEEEVEFLQKAKEEGVYYLIGEVEVIAKRESSLLRKFVINYAYTILRKNFRQGEEALAIPRTRLLRVGMTYEL